MLSKLLFLQDLIDFDADWNSNHRLLFQLRELTPGSNIYAVKLLALAIASWVRYSGLIPTETHSHYPPSMSDEHKTPHLSCFQLLLILFDECLLIDAALMLRTMLPPFEQSGVSKCLSFILFCVNRALGYPLLIIFYLYP